MNFSYAISKIVAVHNRIRQNARAPHHWPSGHLARDGFNQFALRPINVRTFVNMYHRNPTFIVPSCKLPVLSPKFRNGPYAPDYNTPMGSKTVMPTPRLEVLVIENNPAEARLTLEAFREVGLTEGVRCLPDGDEALDYLRQEGRHSGAEHPHIIFLDLNLPKKPGLVVLKEIKSNPDLMVIPVIVVSGSTDPKEIREAYELHATCFIRKPSDLDDLIRFISTCYAFWGTVVTLPPPKKR